MSEDEERLSSNGKPLPKSAWKPGQTGNAGGRPKSLREVNELARRCCPSAIARLHQIAHDPKTPPVAAVAACRELLDRGLGRASMTSVSISVDGGSIDSIVGEDPSALILAARLAGRDGKTQLLAELRRIEEQEAEDEQRLADAAAAMDEARDEEVPGVTRLLLRARSANANGTDVPAVRANGKMKG